MYSLKDMAKELETTWQSIRSWKEQFYQFVPMEVDGKQVYFKPEAKEVFLFIKQAKDKGYDHHEIRMSLNEKFGQAEGHLMGAEAQPQNQADMVMMDRKMVEEMQETIQALQLEVSELKKRWTEVEVAQRDQALMDNLREMRDKKPQKKGLWSRVMNFTF